MTIAGWDTPFTRFYLDSLAARPNIDVESMGADQALEAVLSNIADVALLPTDMALLNGEGLDILPAAAVSTWSNPFAALRLPDGFQSGTVYIEAGHDARLQKLVASVVLKEHYRILVEKPGEESPLEAFDSAKLALDGSDLAKSDQEAADTAPLNPGDRLRLFARSISADPGGFPLEMDLGKEWYELSNYPMVWGLFVTKKKEAFPERILQLRNAVHAIDEARVDAVNAWMEGQSGDDSVMESFCLNDLRMRLDDMALASLSELCDYLYYYGRSESIPAVAFASLPTDEELENGSDPLGEDDE